LAGRLPFAGGLQQPGLVVAALALTGVIFAVLGVITGVGGPTPLDQHVFVANVLIAPLALAARSSTGQATDRSVAEAHPPGTDLLPRPRPRDTATPGCTGAALGVAAVLAAGQFLLAAILLQRGWALKT